MIYKTHNQYQMEEQGFQSSSDEILAAAVIARAVHDFVKAWENKDKPDVRNKKGDTRRLYRNWEECLEFLEGSHDMAKYWFQAAGLIPYTIRDPAQFYWKLRSMKVKEKFDGFRQ